MAAWLKRPLTWWRAAAWSLALAPLLMLAWRAAQADLGANPVETLEHETGLWSLRLLWLTLAMTPLRGIIGRGEPIQIRRLLGLWAFAYVCLHFIVYLTFDLQWSVRQLAEDLVKRTYITIGFAAWLLLLPLAITSTKGFQRRLKRRWKQLHRLVYPAAMLAALHFWWLVKSDIREPALYAGILAVLLLGRLPLQRIIRGRSNHPAAHVD